MTCDVASTNRHPGGIVPRFNNVEDLKNFLEKDHNISTAKWDVLKGLGGLFKELQVEDCFLQVVDGELLRKVDVIRVRCFYENENGEKFQLIEDKQVFVNGTERRRNWDYVAEKKKLDEEAETGAYRALEEELQIPGHSVQLIAQEDMNISERKSSPTYEGLTCIYTYYNFLAQIPKDQYKPEYQEVQRDKTTFFSWKKLG